MSKDRGITISLIAVILVVGAGLLDLYILYNGLPTSQGTANVVIGVLTAWNNLALIVASYFFGSSHDSARAAEIKSSTETKP